MEAEARREAWEAERDRQGLVVEEMGRRVSVVEAAAAISLGASGVGPGVTMQER